VTSVRCEYFTLLLFLKVDTRRKHGGVLFPLKLFDCRVKDREIAVTNKKQKA
jgi:hypothetical protein